MARGFESKSVADQQEAAFQKPPQAAPGAEPVRRKLELARIDVRRRLDAATDPRMQEMLRRALSDLDKALGGPARTGQA